MTAKNWNPKIDRMLHPTVLDCKYNLEGDGEHPHFQRKGWREAVANEDTLLGYWEWVSREIWQYTEELCT